MLETEGHTVVQKGKTNIKYYVKDYEKALFTLKQIMRKLQFHRHIPTNGRTTIKAVDVFP